MCATVALAMRGVDYSTLQSVETHQCWKNTGLHFAIPRAYKSFGAFDTNGPRNVANARAAGFEYVDIYMFPCRGKDAASQVADLVNQMGNSNYGQIWLDIETNESTGCSWAGHSGDSNCAYVNELISAIKSHGKVPGVYSSYYMWESIMGHPLNCGGHNGIPLWYAHYDNSQSFSDFHSFGGWSKPNIKQYAGTTTLCGGGVDFSWYP
ncbi:hypothetical protein FGO68_gene6955 [Halteria grandinella]|uniref:Lysozyme n=1 Tax=Halteria grandinella TaxID=5974 RepID=A0A8J8SZ91_HALGN|nr:hypothetical protein FGO68_gene9767 [Halteria grandinella]TNV75756.1 hypothetical protein FGO68_gene6955 [Halteria grandinella]